MRVELSYISAASNCSPNICDWGQNGLLCYGSCNSIIIFDPKHPGTNKDLNILTGHTKKVSVVKWIANFDQSCETELISGSNDGTAIIWSLNDNKYQPTILQGHTDGVNVIDAIYTDVQNRSLLIVSSSIDSTLRIWKRSIFGEDVLNTQTIDFKHGLCLALSLTFLPHSQNLIMACARDTSHIQLYVQTEDEDLQEEFKIIETLKGHENWVPGLTFATEDSGDLLLASSSQDCFIRLWRVSSFTPVEQTENKLSMKILQKKFSVETKEGTKQFTVKIESVLCGHEGWVYEVKWAPKIRKTDGTFTQPMKLLSCSLDKTMLIWTLQDSLWMESVRVGEVGGNTLGFYGCKFSPNGNSIISHGYLGSFHLWNFNSELNIWEPGVTIAGHSNEVIDVAWEPHGKYLMSISFDQTTRIHAPWVKNDGKDISWHEIARPQVHGYDMSCFAILSRYKFVSGAEEKIIRAFSAPSNFVVNFRYLSNISNDEEGDEIMNAKKGGPKGASVPSLGLSNKAVYESSNENQVKPTGKEYYAEETYFHEVHLKAPPNEEDLIQNTLWPEVQKLYGHGYEMFSLAGSHDGNLVASACKATTLEHASIILWNAENWQQLQKLSSHTLTVTQLSFSPDNNKLLSVSRDRRWSVFERNEDTNEFSLVSTTDKITGIHTRIIWCCAWTHDSKYFITGSRDGKAVIWTKNDDIMDISSQLGKYEAVGVPLEINGQSITAVAFSPSLVDGYYLLSIGMDSGNMEIYKWNTMEGWLPLWKSAAHHLTIKRISFRPCEGLAGLNVCEKRLMQLASCSSDFSVKIHNLYLSE